MTTMRLISGAILSFVVAGISTSGCGSDVTAGTGGGHTGTTTETSSSGSTTTGTSSSSGMTTTTGTGGSGATGGGGAGGCGSAADCDDGFSCTIDTCTAGTCSHAVGPNSGPTACPAGTFCEVHKGCIPGEVCATTDQCVQKLGGDACKANIQCDAATSICTYQTLDKDFDGHPPVVCGGDDCNDADGAVYPGAPEGCDGKDNDCNGATDEGATCGGMATCQNGQCVCPPEDTCGGACVDKSTSQDHCGACFNKCPSAATCVAGTCQCAPGATVCSGQCVDIKSDPENCNGCGNTCAPGYQCQNGACSCLQTSCNGACVDTMTDPNFCGSCTNKCPAGTACVNGACVCPGTSKVCNGACVDTSSDVNNCGGCGVTCPTGNTCQNGMCAGCPAADLFLMVDLSSSMANTLVSASRLQEAKTGINAFMAEPQTAPIGVGLGYFPAPNAPCAASSYTTPAVGIATGNAGAISGWLAGASVSTTSPQAPALQGALTYAKSYAMAHAGHKAAVVLITDGLPDSCTTSGVPTDVANIAATFANGTPSVKTFVIALGGDVTPSSWNAIAAAGGTGAAVQVTMNTAMHDVKNALEGVRTVFADCPTGAACAHAECITDAALSPSCSSCSKAICLQDPFCCTSSWDQICTQEVPTFCAPMTCP